MNKKSKQHPDYIYVAALLHNDNFMIEEIYKRFAKKIMYFVLKNSGTKKDAQDLFQEALLDIFEQAKQSEFVLTCPFEAYLYFVCRNKWLNRLRKKDKDRVTTLKEELSNEEECALELAEETILKESRHRLFVLMFKKLGESCQNILRFSWKGIPLDQIAKELNISYGYVRKKKVECLGRLTQLVTEHAEYKDLANI